jgi:hypothetical protein
MLRVTISNLTSSGEHKFKVVAVIISDITERERSDSGAGPGWLGSDRGTVLLFKLPFLCLSHAYRYTECAGIRGFEVESDFTGQIDKLHPALS